MLSRVLKQKETLISKEEISEDIKYQKVRVNIWTNPECSNIVNMVYKPFISSVQRLKHNQNNNYIYMSRDR
jgi:hypothetical protein